MRVRLLILCALCVPALLAAQTHVAPAAPAVWMSAAGDTAVRHTAARDTAVPHIRWNEDSLIAARTASSDTVFRPKKSTTIAMLSSMVLPGAGQIYNGAYWKAPIVWGFGAYFVWAYRTQNDKYRTYRDQYAAAVTSASPPEPSVLANLKGNRQFYYDERNKFGWYVAITYLITIVDAYVDASLYNFEVSPDLQPHGEWKATLHLRLR